ncbi:MAG: hypothetical protein R2713_11320 [Ilumatobacteraceae bacterium]
MRPGETVALVGASGAGKTIRRRCCLYDVSDGALRADGHDVRAISPRRACGRRSAW